MSLDVLHLRRPKIDYVSPPICEVLFTGTGTTTIVLDPFTRVKITGIVIEDDGFGNLSVHWPNFPGALCYNIYHQLENGSYVLLAECVPCCQYPLPPGTGLVRIAPITPDDGEGDLSDPVAPPPPPIPPVVCTDFIDDTGTEQTPTFHLAGQGSGLVIGSKAFPSPVVLRPWKYQSRVSSDLRTARASGAIQASQTGDLVTADADFFLSTDVNKFLRFTAGGDARQIIQFLSPTVVQVAVTEIVASDTFTVYGQTLGGNFGQALMCNSAGHIIGIENDTTEQPRAFWFNNTTGEIRDIGSGLDILLEDINESGFVLYQFFDGLANTTFVYNPNNQTSTQVGTTGVDFGDALNDNLVVVGDTDIGSGEFHAFKWVSGVLTDIHPADAGTGSGAISEGTIVNNSGLIAGTYTQQVTGRSRVFYNNGGASTSIGFFAAGTDPFNGYVVLDDLSESGTLVGGADIDGTGLGIAAGYKWTEAGGMIQLLPVPGKTQCHARSVNEAGYIVGSSYTTAGIDEVACVWRPGQLAAEDLNSFLTPSFGANWVLLQAWHVTENKEIVGVGLLSGNFAVFFTKICAL